MTVSRYSRLFLQTLTEQENTSISEGLVKDPIVKGAGDLEPNYLALCFDRRTPIQAPEWRRLVASLQNERLQWMTVPRFYWETISATDKVIVDHYLMS